MNFDTQVIMQALEIMVIGMSGIFAALFIIYLVSVVLLKVFPENKK